MTVESDQRIAFLKKIHLFRSLTDEQITAVADKLEEETHPAGKAILAEGKSSDRFFLIYRGKVRITRTRKGKEEQLAAFVAGDYFGEMGVTLRGPRYASVSAEEETLLLALSRQDFVNFVKQFPKFKTSLEIAISSRRLAHKYRFKWKRYDEVIYFLARKHPIILWESLIGPLFGIFLLASFIWALYAFVQFLSKKGELNISIIFIAIKGIGLLGLFIIAGWIVWEIIDWGNDYYIVTNQRVIWIEKIIMKSSTRQEAPLSTILSVNTDTYWLGRQMGYGDVIVRTYVGKITLHNILHPDEASALVEEQWRRIKEVYRGAEKEAMKEALRARLLPNQETAIFQKSAVSTRSTPVETLFEGVEIVTYRKHWFILLQKTWQPITFALLFLGVSGFISFLSRIQLSQLVTYIACAALFYAIMGFWWLYEFTDWKNDIYQVTSDQIVDIYKKPWLGREQRSVAPLENILSIEFEQIGPMANLLNFGTVYITVGSTKFIFENVFRPAAVQEDIDRRRLIRIFKKQEAEATAERDRMVDWFAEYHRSTHEFPDKESLQREESPKDSDQSDVQ